MSLFYACLFVVYCDLNIGFEQNATGEALNLRKNIMNNVHFDTSFSNRNNFIE